MWNDDRREDDEDEAEALKGKYETDSVVGKGVPGRARAIADIVNVWL